MVIEIRVACLAFVRGAVKRRKEHCVIDTPTEENVRAKPSALTPGHVQILT